MQIETGKQEPVRERRKREKVLKKTALPFLRHRRKTKKQKIIPRTGKSRGAGNRVSRINLLPYPDYPGGTSQIIEPFH
jgi:hypothetical protein